MARRLCANQRRGAERRRRLNGALVTNFRSAVWTSPEDGGLRDALDGLGDDDREILRLAAWEGLTPAELAAVLGCSVNAASIRLHRARRRLAEKLARDEERSGVGRTRSGWKGGDR